jgi:hypothetical protein
MPGLAHVYIILSVCACRSGAYTTLSEYVGLRRRAAAAQVAAASQAGGSSGPMLQDFPEFMLPYIIQVSHNNFRESHNCSFYPRKKTTEHVFLSQRWKK